VRSVANGTRQDARQLLSLAAAGPPLRVEAEGYPLAEANACWRS